MVLMTTGVASSLTSKPKIPEDGNNGSLIFVTLTSIVFLSPCSIAYENFGPRPFPVLYIASLIATSQRFASVKFLHLYENVTHPIKVQYHTMMVLQK